MCIILLWRVHDGVLLVQATAHADTTMLPLRYSVADPVEIDCTERLHAIQVHQEYQFALYAYPCKRDFHANKVIAYHNDSERREWFIRQGSRLGFALTTTCPLTITVPAPVRGQRSHQFIRYDAVYFTGSLAVTDPSALQQACYAGVGRGKANGLGLLTIEPILPVAPPSPSNSDC